MIMNITKHLIAGLRPEDLILFKNDISRACSVSEGGSQGCFEIWPYIRKSVQSVSWDHVGWIHGSGVFHMVADDIVHII